MERQAALHDHLDALCRSLAGRCALGHAADDPMPSTALEEADGLTGEANLNWRGT
ncbi:hypothetical protein [Streptomyces formicae]|uniref:Uncharacterized protein n=1 Tax=Streptomyces formicae TaxID=1616117 RepID=A0A291QIW6_9ACTN|nr:hypothetical protein [Streptomyces formicae]ATL31522.1 hypothetical protein KY5_6504c [Streptomyces formicae]